MLTRDASLHCHVETCHKNIIQDPQGSWMETPIQNRSREKQKPLLLLPGSSQQK